MSHVDIAVTPDSIQSTVSIDGRQVEGVRSFAIHAEVGQPSRVYLEPICQHVTVTGHVQDVIDVSTVGGEYKCFTPGHVK